MKVRVYALFALMALAAAAQAQERISDSYAFRVGAGFGMLFGESRELVYRSPDTEDLESLLQWHLEPLIYYKSVLEFKRTEPLLGFGVNAGLNVGFGFDGNTGKMTDKDWDVDTGELWSDTTHAIWTDGAVMVDGKVGLTWPLFNLVTLGVSVKASYLSFNWTALDGNSSPLVEYWQKWFLLYGGVSALVPVKRVFSVGFGVNFSPLIWCEGRDYHIARGLLYEDRMSGGWSIEPEIECSLKVNRWLKVSADISWRYMSGARGNTRATDTASGESADYEGTAGAGYSVFNAGLTARVTW